MVPPAEPAPWDDFWRRRTQRGRAVAVGLVAFYFGMVAVMQAVTGEAQTDLWQIGAGVALAVVLAVPVMLRLLKPGVRRRYDEAAHVR